MHIERFETIESTSLHARHLIESGRGPTVPTTFIAAQQTGGIGRQGRRWWSPPGGLWMTIVIPNPTPVRPDHALSVGLAIATQCEAATNNRVSLQLKWPNDVMLDGRKLSGVLIESVSHGGRPFLLIGAGVNTNNDLAMFPPDLRDRTARLRTPGSPPINHDRLEAALIAAICRAVETPESELPPLHSAIRQRLWGIDKTVMLTLPGGDRTLATIKGLTPSLDLLVEIDGKPTTLRSIDAME